MTTENEKQPAGRLKNIKVALIVLLVGYGLIQYVGGEYKDYVQNKKFEKISFADITSYSRVGIIGVTKSRFSKNRLGKIITSKGEFALDRVELAKFDIGDAVGLGAVDKYGLYILCKTTMEETRSVDSCARLKGWYIK